MTKIEKYSTINSIIFVIGTILWFISYSTLYLELIMIIYVTILLSIFFAIANLIKLFRKKWRAIIFVLIALIPILDTWTDFHEKAYDFFKPEKELIAIKNWGSSTSGITLRLDNSFEYKEQSPYGAKIFKGEFTWINDTLNLKFFNNKPSFIKDKEIVGYIQDNELIIKSENNKMEFQIRYRKE